MPIPTPTPAARMAAWPLRSWACQSGAGLMSTNAVASLLAGAALCPCPCPGIRPACASACWIVAVAEATSLFCTRRAEVIILFMNWSSDFIAFQSR